MVGKFASLGSAQPDFILGGSSTLAWKSFTLGGTFEWKNGGLMYSGTNGLMKSSNGLDKSTLSLREKLVTRNDPRKDVFWVYPDGKGFENLEVFVENGNSVQDQSRFARSRLSSSTFAVSGVRNTAPTFMMSYHELLFLKAEAQVRLGQLTEAEATLKLAVRAAFAQVNNLTGGLTEAMADEYFTDNVKPLFDANPLGEVMTQKYLSFYECEALEAYHDYRRCKAMGDSWTNGFLKNMLPFPLRFTYGNSDVSSNSNIGDIFGNGEYVYKENVWWAGGTR